MIKSLLDADENPPPETKVIVEETIVEQPSPSVLSAVADENVFTPEQIGEVEDILEIPSARGNNAPNHYDEQKGARNAADYLKSNEANFQSAEIFAEQSNAPSETATTPINQDAPLFQAAYEPETQAETMRKSGLAYATAITLFGAVVFMMILGWGADLLFGSSPWGIVGGIVLGALIGFVQFFRLSSQIFK